mgnify:CR=1 FL=1
MSFWLLSSSSDRRALDVVDGVGRFSGHGLHYSRRTPGFKMFTGVGQQTVLVGADGTAVWAVVRQRTPSAVGSGASRGRSGELDRASRWVWRNMMFRNLGDVPSSSLVVDATRCTYEEWSRKYGFLPLEVLHPGYCCKKAGYHNQRVVRRKIYLDAPCPALLLRGECSCCPQQSRRELARVRAL